MEPVLLKSAFVIIVDGVDKGAQPDFERAKQEGESYVDGKTKIQIVHMGGPMRRWNYDDATKQWVESVR